METKDPASKESTALSPREDGLPVPSRVAPRLDWLWAPYAIAPFAAFATHNARRLPNIGNPLSIIVILVASGFHLDSMSSIWTVLARLLVGFGGSIKIGAILHEQIVARLYHPLTGEEMLESATHLCSKAATCKATSELALRPLEAEIREMESELAADRALADNELSKMSPEMRAKEKGSLDKHKNLLDNAADIIKGHRAKIDTAVGDIETLYRYTRRYGRIWRAGIADTATIESQARERINALAIGLRELAEQTATVAKAVKAEIEKFNKKIAENP